MSNVIPHIYVIPYVDEAKSDEVCDDFFTEGGTYDLCLPHTTETFVLVAKHTDSIIVKSITPNESRVKFTLTTNDCNWIGIPYEPGLEIFPQIDANDDTLLWRRHDPNAADRKLDIFDLSTYPSVSNKDYYINSILIKISGFSVDYDIIKTDWTNRFNHISNIQTSFVVKNKVRIGSTDDLDSPCFGVNTEFPYTIVTYKYAHTNSRCNCIDVDGNMYLRIWMMPDNQDSQPQWINPDVFHHLSFDEIFELKYIPTTGNAAYMLNNWGCLRQFSGKI